MNTGSIKTIYNSISISVFSFVFGIVFILSGCGRTTTVTSDASVREENTDVKLTEGNVALSAAQLASYADVRECLVRDDKETVGLSLSLPDIPRSDDSMIYLFAFELYEDGTFPDDFEGEPIASTKKAAHCEMQWAYDSSQLFKQFVPALLMEGRYVPLSEGVCICNPEILADGTVSVPEPESKKGLLLDPQMIDTPQLTELDVKYAIYNIPLSHILGDTTNELFPTISYEYRGKTYKFNGASINGYDYLFTYLTENGMNATAIILNDWNEACPELIHPLSRNQEAGAYYYAFNTAEEDGCVYLEAIASFLAERYSGKEHGLVSNWVIANEINQHKIWNYMDTVDCKFYAAEFEKAMRIFYNAAKSQYADANVYFSIDHDWNNNKGSNKNHFNARDLVREINNITRKKGNYDWGLAIHPYPEPLTKVNYWTETYDKATDAPILTLMNLSTITDVLKQEEYLDRSGEVRSITVTELGFSSASGEKLQAAAFAYCYYIIEANPYVDAFIMNRQTDALEEVKQGLAFGIYDLDQSPKYIFDTFKYIDTDEAQSHTEFMLNILGAESLEEALSWAQ